MPRENVPDCSESFCHRIIKNDFKTMQEQNNDGLFTHGVCLLAGLRGGRSIQALSVNYIIACLPTNSVIAVLLDRSRGRTCHALYPRSSIRNTQ